MVFAQKQCRITFYEDFFDDFENILGAHNIIL